MKVPKLAWALLILAMGFMVASWGVGIFDPRGVEAPGCKLFQLLWLWFSTAAMGVACGSLAAFSIRQRSLRKLSKLIAGLMSNADGLSMAREHMAELGWEYSETGGDEGDKEWIWTKGDCTIKLTGTARRMQVGDRVTAFVCTDSKARILKLLGEGVLAGRQPVPAEWGMPDTATNPRIDLDCGKSVWGMQCWWGTTDQVAKAHPKPEWTWEQVDVDAFLKEWNEHNVEGRDVPNEPAAQPAAGPTA